MLPIDVQEFAGRVVKALGEQNIAKAMIYGSFVRGEFRAGESDVDLLVVTRGKMRQASMSRFNREWLEGLLHGIPFEVVFMDVGEYQMLKDLGSPYLSSVEREGYTLYDGGVEEEYLRRLFDKARRWLAGAEDEISKGEYEYATVKGYNAIELAIRAALIMKGVTERVKTHGGMIQRFGELYVLPGEFPREHAAKLGECLSAGGKSLYEVLELTEREAKATVEAAGHLMRWLEGRLPRAEQT